MKFYIYVSQQYNVTFSLFQDITANQNGAVISITESDLDLYISTNSFKSCCAVGENLGGCIYLTTNKTLIIKNTCAYNCSAHAGYFYYIDGYAVLANTELNETSTLQCWGSQYAVYANYHSDLLSSKYNSSHCYSINSWCNVHSWNNDKSYAEYYQFYHNKLDILFGANSNTLNNTINHVILISNTNSTGQKGFFHVNSDGNGGLYIKNAYAFDNEGYLINCDSGNIIIESLICDHYSFINMTVSTENVTESNDITRTFFFDSYEFCAFIHFLPKCAPNYIITFFRHYIYHMFLSP